MTRQQVEQFSQATQRSGEVRGIQSYVNLTEGKAVCVLEASSKGILEKFFKKMGMPYDSVTPVELQGVNGIIHAATQTSSRTDQAEWPPT